MIDRAKFNKLSKEEKDFLAEVTYLPEWDENINGVTLGEEFLIENIEGHCSTENDKDGSDVDRFIKIISKLISGVVE